MLVKVKALNSEAVLPSYAKDGDGALDITAIGIIKDTEEFIEYSTGLAFEIPPGYVGLLFPRSSVSNRGLSLCNSVGVLDSGYRGEVTFRFKPTPGKTAKYSPGDRIGQLLIIPYPQITPMWADSLSNSARGKGGYGSTGTR